MEPEKLKALVKAAKAAASTDWEKSFCKDQSKRIKEWGGKVKMSEKQIAVLRKIASGKEEEDEEEKEGKELPV